MFILLKFYMELNYYKKLDCINIAVLSKEQQISNEMRLITINIDSGCWEEDVIQSILKYLAMGNQEVRSDLITTMIEGKNVQYVNKVKTCACEIFLNKGCSRIKYLGDGRYIFLNPTTYQYKNICDRHHHMY